MAVITAAQDEQVTVKMTLFLIKCRVASEPKKYMITPVKAHRGAFYLTATRRVHLEVRRRTTRTHNNMCADAFLQAATGDVSFQLLLKVFKRTCAIVFCVFVVLHCAKGVQ